MPGTVLIETDIQLMDGHIHHLEVSSPVGGGESYHVMVDNYYTGSLIRYMKGWEARVTGPLICGDDISVLLDMVEKLS